MSSASNESGSMNTTAPEPGYEVRIGVDNEGLAVIIGACLGLVQLLFFVGYWFCAGRHHAATKKERLYDDRPPIVAGQQGAGPRPGRDGIDGPQHDGEHPRRTSGPHPPAPHGAHGAHGAYGPRPDAAAFDDEEMQRIGGFAPAAGGGGGMGARPGDGGVHQRRTPPHYDNDNGPRAPLASAAAPPSAPPPPPPAVPDPVAAMSDDDVPLPPEGEPPQGAHSPGLPQPPAF